MFKECNFFFENIFSTHFPSTMRVRKWGYPGSVEDILEKYLKFHEKLKFFRQCNKALLMRVKFVDPKLSSDT